MAKTLKTLIFTLLLFVGLSSNAQIAHNVSWTAEIEADGTEAGTIVFHANVADTWHIYGIEMPADGDPMMMPYPTHIVLADGLEATGPLTCSIEPSLHSDANSGDVAIPWLMGEFELRLPFKVVNATGKVEGTVKYMACTEESCTPPDKYEFSIPFGEASAENVAAAANETANSQLTELPASWAPVEVESETASQSYWAILILGFLGGLVALMTPCVWPMIPMTVSFFLKKSKSRRRSIIDAVIYSASIIVIFLILGIVLTLIFGPGMLNELATSALFNLIFFAILVVFAISFFGAFEIQLPSKWSNAIDARVDNTTGVLSIFFMAFTLVLVSFSCTGPIIGTLLVEAFSQGNLLGPLLGMGGFAVGLALPFGLFAFFPSMLKELPRSGGWLNSVKVVLGFIELILSLKFLSVADLAYGWRILDREVFLAIWIVLFVLLGLYLLGKLRFSHDGPTETTSVTRFFLAVTSFSFAVYLVPGLWGAPLKSISAFAPPLYTQDFNLYGGSFEEYDDYDKGMAIAEAEGKPVLLDFSGYACVNCRKMEGAVFDNASVRTLIEENYVMIKLMVDDKANLPTPMIVEEEGQIMKLTTVGERWAYLQRHKFGINSQPYYVLLDNTGKPLNAPRVYDEDVDAFTKWLEEGIEVYQGGN